MQSVWENVRQLCLSAVQYVRGEQWGSAVQAFLEALAAQPEGGGSATAPFVDDLCVALSNFCAQLPPPQALWIAAKVCEHCADARVHHLYSKLLCENGQAHVAVQVLQQHIQHIDSGTNALLLESSENAKNLCVDRWHFRMLNDKARNEAYDQAIRAAVQRLGVGCTILDIGGGTGLLSMMAVRAGAAHVICCEMNPAMCAIAQQCIEANGFADSITILPVHSSKLTPAMLRERLGGQSDGKVDLVVTELMDSGLLGEHMIAALRHASRELLRPGGLVIPHSAVVVGQLIESDEIRRRKLYDPTRNPANPRPLSEFYAAGGQKFVVDEAYTCEPLRSLPHTALCEPFELLHIDFLPAVAQTQSERHSVLVPATTNGRIDALAYWFAVRMLPNEDIFFDTHPSREGCGWDQAILFMHTILAADGGDVEQQQQAAVEAVVTMGQRLGLRCEHDDDHIAVVVAEHMTETLICVSRGAERLYFSGTACVAADVDGDAVQVGEMDVALLHDTIRSDAYTAAIGRTCEHFRRRFPSTKLSIIELVDTWTPHATAVLSQYFRRGNRGRCEAIEVVSIASSDESTAVAEECLPIELRLSVAQCTGYAMEVCDPGRGSRFQVCVADVVEGCGMIRQQCLEELYFIREFLADTTLLAGHAILKFIPHQVRVVVQVAECPSLRIQHQVDDVNTVGIQVSDSINPFGVLQLRELDLAHTPDLRWLTAPHEVLRIPLGLFESDPVLLGGPTEVSLPVLVDGRAHAICYWFRIQMLENDEDEEEDDLTLDTGPHNQHWQHWRQAAFLLPGDRAMSGEALNFAVFINRIAGLWISSR